MLSRDQILNHAVKIETVNVPDLGDVGIRVMSASDLERWNVQRKDENTERFYAKLLTKCVCDPQGKRLFTDDDFDGISELPAGTLSKLWEAAAKLNKILPEQVDDAAKKN